MANKNVLILKQLEDGFSTSNKPLSGIVRIENESGFYEISLSLINLSALIGGEFFLYIFGKNNQAYTFPLSNRPTNFRKTLEDLQGVSDGFGSALVAVRSDIPLTVAFGKTEQFELSLSTAKKLIADKCLSSRKNTKRKEISEPSAPPPPLEAEKIDSPYNDEAVATVNYFELDQELKEKLDKIKEPRDEDLSNANGDAFNQCQKEKEENSNGADFLQNEADFIASQVKDDRPFYITAEHELKTLFEKFPPYDNLKGFFPDSKWAKICYDGDRYYIVGLIKEDKREKYICYGVPATYSNEPPKELKGYCTFIPLSIFDMQGEGFWMMFQDAVTGECIFPK